MQEHRTAVEDVRICRDYIRRRNTIRAHRAYANRSEARQTRSAPKSSAFFCARTAVFFCLVVPAGTTILPVSIAHSCVCLRSLRWLDDEWLSARRCRAAHDDVVEHNTLFHVSDACVRACVCKPTGACCWRACTHTLTQSLSGRNAVHICVCSDAQVRIRASV